MPYSKSWLYFNGTAVLRGDENKVNNASSYIYFYNFFSLISLSKGGWISLLVFRCDDPTYNPSPCALCFARGLGYLSLPVDVTTLHITPVMLTCMVKMLLYWWWFGPTAWHAHNHE